jgi:uncharacterized protein
VELRVSRASAVVVQKVPPALEDRFLEWQRGIAAEAEQFPGYHDTNVHPPGDGRTEWVVLINFEDEKSLKGWLDSPVRAQWVEKLRAQVGDFELKALPSGFGPWFLGLGQQARKVPSWKFALTVLLGLYPLTMLLTVFPGHLTSPLGYAVALLIGQVLSCSILQWVVTPALTRVLGPWLTANAPHQRVLSYGGLFLIVAVLAILCLVFRLAKIAP